jgi:hypothetical protein
VDLTPRPWQVENSLGIGPLYYFGNEDQKKASPTWGEAL